MFVAIPLRVRFIPNPAEHTYNIIQKFSGDSQEWSITGHVKASSPHSGDDSAAEWFYGVLAHFGK